MRLRTSGPLCKGERFCTDASRSGHLGFATLAHRAVTFDRNQQEGVQLGKSGSNEARNAQIFSRRIDGLSFAAIAREFELSTETVRLTIRQMDRKAMWREIERNAQRERVALLGRSFGRFLVSFRSTN